MSESLADGSRGPSERHHAGDDDTTGSPEGEVVVVSNRQPYRHRWSDGEIAVDRPAGGLTAALDDVVRQVDGCWIAWGDGDADADVVDDDDRVAVPPEADDQYPLRRVWLADEDVEDYYYGFSNQVLWPVCHGALTHVRCDAGYWDTYRDVNEQFADAVAESVDSDDVVWLQDYHFSLVPALLRSRLDDGAVVAHFWHVPWPDWDTFRACPHGEELLRGLLGNDLLGVHLERYRQNLLDCVEVGLPDTTVDRETGRVYHRDGVTTVEAFPLGVDTEHIHETATGEGAADRWDRLRSKFDIGEDVSVGVGVDRLDYTKGVPQRIEAVEHLLETRPEWRGEFTYLQVGSESRSRIPAYQAVQQEVHEAVERANERFRTDDWRPVVYTTDWLSDEELYTLYRNADVGVVSPIRDGMNLVAQEYAAAQVDSDGVLVLSRQAGAHDRLGDAAVSITPQDTEAFARGLHEALSMPRAERSGRAAALRECCEALDVGGWVDDVLARTTQLANRAVVAGATGADD